jgi:hypothetical protein
MKLKVREAIMGPIKSNWNMSYLKLKTLIYRGWHLSIAHCGVLDLQMARGFLQIEEEHPLYNPISMKLDVYIPILS